MRSTCAGRRRKPPIKLSIIIPAYNEQHRLPAMLDRYLDYFVERYGDEVELIVVVNGSTDRTPDLVQEYAERFPQVRPIIEPRSIGKGGAVIRGFRASRGDLVGFVDADGATPPAAFQDLVDRIGEAGLIIASRWLPGADVQPRQPVARRVASRIFNGLVRLLFKLRISDTQCGAKLLRRDVMERVLPQLGMTKWAFDVDLLFRVRRAQVPIEEVPTTWHDRAGSKVNVPRASLEMFLAIVRLRLVYSPLHGLVAAYDYTLGRQVHKRW